MDHWFTAIIGVAASIFALVSGGVTTYVLYRSKNAEIIKGEMEAYKAKAERLDKERQSDAQALHDRDVEIADLKARTDLSEIRKGQSNIMEIIAKQSSALLENQAIGLERGHNIEKVMIQMVATLEKMEQRLDRGLIMK